jgi:hypothetical protein
MNITSLQSFQPARAPQTRASAPAEQAPATAGDSVTIGQQPAPAQTQPQPQPAPPEAPAPGQPGNPGSEIKPKDWTILVYSVSDNNLYEFMQADLDEAERVGSTNEMNILVETSHQPKGGSVQRIKLESDQTEGLKSPVLQDLGKTHDMAKSDAMAESIAWAMEKYPSKHTMVVVSDHGGGWLGANHSESTDSWMSAQDLEDGFKKAQQLTGKKVDVIGFDQCLMASTEVAYQLRDCASYMVGSEEVEGGAGWQYDQVVGKTSQKKNRVLTGQVLNYAAAALRARDPLTPADMAKGIVQMAEGHQRDLGTMSAIDLSKIPALTTAVDNFAGAVLESGLTAKDFAPVKQDTQKFYEFADMGHFVQLAGEKFGGKIKEAADAVQTALSEAVIAEQHSSDYPNAKGLNIEINKNYGMHGGQQGGGVGAGGQLGDAEMEQLMQIMVMAMSPEQLQQLYEVMPMLIELNAQFHAQNGGGAPELQQAPPAEAPAQNNPPKYDIPNMSKDAQNRMDFAPYENITWSKDTRWDEMLQQVG